MLTRELDKFNDPVRIDVGVDSDRETFHTSAELLATRSVFFRKALSKEWKECTDRVIRLPEDSAEIFSLYMHLLHTGELAIRVDHNGDAWSGDEQYKLLTRLYVLAEKLQDVKTKNAALKAITKFSLEVHVEPNGKNRNHLPSIEHVNTIYGGTVAGSMARKLLVHMYVYDKTSAWDPRAEAWSKEFVCDFAAELLTRRQKYQTVETSKGKGRNHPKNYVEKRSMIWYGREQMVTCVRVQEKEASGSSGLSEIVPNYQYV